MAISCAEEKAEDEKRPANILDEDRFSDLLADFALAESAASLNIRNASLREMDTVYAFDPLKFGQVRKGQYDSSLLYYSQHPKLYKAAYEKTLAKLTEMESRRAAIKTDSASK